MLRLDRPVWGYTAGDKLRSEETGEIVEVVTVKPGLKDIHVERAQDGTVAWRHPAGTGWLLA